MLPVIFIVKKLFLTRSGPNCCCLAQKSRALGGGCIVSAPSRRLGSGLPYPDTGFRFP